MYRTKKKKKKKKERHKEILKVKEQSEHDEHTCSIEMSCCWTFSIHASTWLSFASITFFFLRRRMAPSLSVLTISFASFRKLMRIDERRTMGREMIGDDKYFCSSTWMNFVLMVKNCSNCLSIRNVSSVSVIGVPEIFIAWKFSCVETSAFFFQIRYDKRMSFQSSWSKFLCANESVKTALRLNCWSKLSNKRVVNDASIRTVNRQ